MRIIAWLIGIAALLGSGGYMLLYVSLWQWNRALFSGMAFVTVSFLLATAIILRRLDRMTQRLDDVTSADRPGREAMALRGDLEATRPQRDHFRWLHEQTTQTNVFITMLLGGGAVISALAWVVGRVAESTTTPQAEDQLTKRMSPLAYPDAGLVPPSEPGSDPATLLLQGPTGRPDASDRAEAR